MNGEIITRVALIVIAAVFALIGAYVIPLIKTKIGSENMEKLMEFVKTAVRCANQIFTSEQKQEKKEYVVRAVKEFAEKNLNVKFTDEQIDTIIEGVLNGIKSLDKKAAVAVAE